MSKLSPLQALRKLALHNLEVKVSDKESALAFLKRWWCTHYNRPYKDPLFETYSLEELLLEYFEVTYYNSKEMKAEAIRDIAILENNQDDEEYEEFLKEKMGDDYMSSEEMAELLNSKGK